MVLCTWSTRTAAVRAAVTPICSATRRIGSNEGTAQKYAWYKDPLPSRRPGCQTSFRSALTTVDSAQSVRRGLRQTIIGSRGSEDLENRRALHASWQAGKLAGLEGSWRPSERAGEERIGSRHLTDLTAISPDSRYVFVWRDQRLSKDMSDRVELSGAARWKWNGVSVLMRCGSYRYLGHFLTPGPPCPRVPHSAGQPQAKSHFSRLVSHSLSLINQPSLPRLWPAPPLHEPLQARRTLQQGLRIFL